MTDDGSSRRRATGALLLGSASYACFTFAWFSLAAYLEPIATALGLSSLQAGVVAGAVPLTYVPLAVSSGLVIDWIGPRRAIAVGLVLVGLAQVTRALAGDFLGLLLPTLVLGVGGTGITFGLPKLVSLLYPSERTGTASSVYMVGSYVGMAGAFGLARTLLGPTLGGWRPLFRWSGLVVVGFAVLWYLGAAGLPTAGTRAGRRRPTAVREDVRAVVAHPGMRLLVVLGVLSLFVIHAVMGWLPTVLEARGFAPAVAATAATGLVVARLVGTVVVPPVSDALGERRGALVATGALLALGLGGLAVSGAGLWRTVAAVLAAGVGLGGLLPFLRVLPIEFDDIGPGLTGTATGLVFSVGQVGGFLGPFLLGALYDATGTYAVGLGVLAAAAVAAAVVGSRLPDAGAGPAS